MVKGLGIVLLCCGISLLYTIVVIGGVMAICTLREWRPATCQWPQQGGHNPVAGLYEKGER